MSDLSHILKDMNDQQKEAITTDKGSYIVYAGAGTGKTTVIARRVAYLLSKGVPPQRILCLSFTRKSAGNMRMRIGDFVGQELLKKMYPKTFHKWCLEFIRHNYKELQLSPRFTILSEYSQHSLMNSVLDDILVNKYHKNSAMSSIGGEILHALELAYCRYDDPEKSVKGNIPLEIYNEYVERLKKRNCLGYSAVIYYAVEWLRKNPKLLKKYNDIYDYVIVDEFQDLNLSQYLLLRCLSYRKCNIFVVGDPDQSIYSWRGSCPDLFSFYMRDYAKTVKQLYLTYNYRSAPVVLEHANQLIQCNPNRLSKPLKAVSDGSLSDLQLYQTRTPEKNIIDVIKSDNQYKNYAILARTNNLIGRESKIEQALKSENIPYVIKSADSLYARPEVKDVIAYFDFLIDTKNDLAVERLLTRNVKLFGEASLKKLRNYTEITGVSIYEALSNVKNVSFGKLTNVLCTRLSDYYFVLTDYLNKCSDMKELTAVYDYILFKLSHGYALKDVDYQGKSSGAYEQTRNDALEEVRKGIVLYVATFGDESIQGWLDYVQDMTTEDTFADIGNKVSLLTFHSAKGLEFDTVFIVGAEYGRTPLIYHGEIKNEPEERNLFYVAMTRAKRRLYVYTSDYDVVNNWALKPSPFLTEAGLCV